MTMAEITFDAISAAEVQATSCNDCKIRKLKCTRRLPCSNCERKNLECTYALAPKTSSKRKRHGAEDSKTSAVRCLTGLSREDHEVLDSRSETIDSGESLYGGTQVTKPSMRPSTSASPNPINGLSAEMPIWEWNTTFDYNLTDESMWTDPSVPSAFARHDHLFPLLTRTASDTLNFSSFSGDLGWLSTDSMGSSELSLQSITPSNNNVCGVVDQASIKAWPFVETAWPRQIRHHHLVKITSLYLRQIHPSIPLYNASEILDGLNSGRYRTDYPFGAMILGLCTFTLVQRQEPNSMLLQNDSLTPSDFLRETIALRRSREVDEIPTLECVVADIHIFGALELLGKKNAAWLKLQEAITLAEILELTNPNNRYDYEFKGWERKFRVHICLVIIERAYTFGQWRRISVPNVPPRILQRFSQLSLQDDIFEDETEGNNLSVLNLMAKTFDCLEGDLVYCWDGSCDIQHGRKCHKLSSERILGLLRRVPGPDHQDWLRLAKCREKKLAQKKDSSADSDENERGDVLLTCLWVLNRLWHLALIHGHVSPDSPSRELRPSFSVWLASEALAVVKSFTINGLEIHGEGLAQKMFHIASDFLQTTHRPLSIDMVEGEVRLNIHGGAEVGLPNQHAQTCADSTSDPDQEIVCGNEPVISLSNTDIANGFLGFFALFKNGKHAYLQDYLGIYKHSIASL